MTKTGQDAAERSPSRGAHWPMGVIAVAVFACASAVVVSSGWFVAASVWGDDPDSPGVAFAAGVALCVAGCELVAASSLALVLRRLELLRVDGPFARALRRGWTLGAFCAMSGLLVLVGLGVAMTALSQLTRGGKAFVIAVFGLCALVPLVPGYEIWRRRAGGKAR